MQTDKNNLSHGLKSRHVTMLSIAGVIGAGLFVGSGRAIAEAGPATILAYILAGGLVVLVMRMLAEMAVASPDTGSFSTYADLAIGKWAGYTIGWLYWWFWVLIIPIEANIAATIINTYVPQMEIWVLSLVITLLLTATNLFSVKNYGEFEFWLALVKVIAIVAFIILGACAIFGLLPSAGVSGVSRLWDTGGFMPNGFGVTIAAAESDEAGKHISKATNSVIWRITLFYILSIFIVIALVPWTDPRLATEGSYVTVLDTLGVPHAKAIIDFVVLTSVTSCLNSSLYTASRMVYSLSRRGDAPACAQVTSRSGTPIVAVLLSTGAAFLAVIANYLVPAKVFGFLMASSGAIALLVYLVIAISQLRLRKRLTAQGQTLSYRMWLFPWLTWAVILFISCVLVVMLLRPDHRLEVVSTLVLAVFVVCSGLLITRRRARVAPGSAVGQGA